MTLNPQKAHPPFARRAGFSLIETVISVACLGILMGGAATALIQIENVYAETESAARITLQADRALSRLTELVGQAVTTDTDFTWVEAQGTSAAGIGFRLLDSVTDADLTYDALNVFIVGPNSGSTACDGLVVARAIDLATAHRLGAGSDGVLGTLDDDTRATANSRTFTPAVEVLIPSLYAPSEGLLFSIQQPTADSRLLEVTIRMNLQEPNGEFLFGEDIVIVEEIALRQ